jgi:hypothetical protein
MNEKENFDYFCVSGYGWSGSSAVVDILKEFDGCVEPDIEFRTIKDPYGIRDLYTKLVEKEINDNEAIKDFLWLSNHFFHKQIRFFGLTVGLNYREKIGKHYMEATQKFVEKLVAHKYESCSWFFLDFKRTKGEILKRKIMHRIFRKNPPNETIYFSHPTDEEFVKYAQEFIDDIFRPVVAKKGRENDSHVILDQGISTQNFLQEMRFVRNSKMIVVDRDPRDQIADLMTQNVFLGVDFKKTHDPSKFVESFKFRRKNLAELRANPDVLILHFEDLLFNYEDSLKKIMNFLILNPGDHTKKKQLFNPEISRKNYGMWKTLLSKDESDLIANELKEYLVQ